MNITDCSNCILAATSTWDDFRRKVICEYEAFRNAGGQAFVGYRIPSLTIDELGHVKAESYGRCSFILSHEGEETSLLIYEGRNEVSATHLPWDCTRFVDPGRAKFELGYESVLSKEEGAALYLLVEIAVSRLQSFGIDALEAGFVTVEWVMNSD